MPESHPNQDISSAAAYMWLCAFGSTRYTTSIYCYDSALQPYCTSMRCAVYDAFSETIHHDCERCQDCSADSDNLFPPPQMSEPSLHQAFVQSICNLMQLHVGDALETPEVSGSASRRHALITEPCLTPGIEQRMWLGTFAYRVFARDIVHHSLATAPLQCRPIVHV